MSRRYQLATALCVVALSTGCGGGSARLADVPCTEIGCTSGLALDLAPITAKLDDAAAIRVCLRRKCRFYSRRRSQGGAFFSVRGLRAGRRVSVRIAVTDGDGRVILRRGVRAPVLRVRPNGPKCPPTCFQVAVHIDRQSLDLVAAG